MEQTLDLLFRLVTGILAFLLRFVLWVDAQARRAMAHAGFDARLQSVAIVTLSVLLILSAYRLFGGVVGILITVFLLLLVAHVLVPDLLGGLHAT